MDQVHVIVKEDDSIRRKIESIALKLQNKYNKKRKINEKLIKKKTPFQRVISAIVNIFCTVVFSIALVFGIAMIASKVRGTAPSVAGYTTMKIATHSMTASGHKQFDKIISKSIDTDTIKIGDKIIFYEYYNSWKFFHLSETRKVDESEIGPYKTGLTFKSFFGFLNDEKVEAAKAGSDLVFHHVVGIYEDKNGERWFTTKGSSNKNVDDWYINEKYVLGIYDDSSVASVVLKVIDTLQSPIALIVCIMAPFLFVAWIVILMCLREVEYAKLEYDIVEEKRKLDDDICLEYNIGFRMSEETKYKVLALAPDGKELYYISLLWEDAKEGHKGIKKYYLRKHVLLKSYKKLRDLNRECEQMFKDGENPHKIALHYTKNKKLIDKEQAEAKRKLKVIRKQNRKATI